MTDTLFDEAGQARDEAIARAEANAAPDWLATAERIVLAVSPGGELTTDDIWTGLTAAGVATHEPRALGAVVRRLAKAGEIVATGHYRPSARRECHARPVPVWRRRG